MENIEAGALFEEILEEGISLKVKVTGNSMAPFVRGGEIVVIKKSPPESLHRGDIIFFKNCGGELVLHRLISRNSQNGLIQTKGDAATIYDEPISEKKVLGKVLSIERGNPPTVTVANMESARWKTFNFFIALFNPPKKRACSVLFRLMNFAGFKNLA